MTSPTPTPDRWRCVTSGHWTSGKYHAERFRTPWGMRWTLRTEGSTEDGYFLTLGAVRSFVAEISEVRG